MKTHLLTYILPCIMIISTFTSSSESHEIKKRSIDLEDTSVHMNDFSLPRFVLPQAYKLIVYVNPQMGLYEGTVSIIVMCMEETSEITLHAHQNLSIPHGKVTLKQIPFGSNFKTLEESTKKPERYVFPQISVTNFKRNIRKQWYTVLLSKRLERSAIYILNIPFVGKLRDATDDGFFRRSYWDREAESHLWYAVTDMKSANAHEVFPCFDEPTFKVPFDISVATQKKYWVLSVMPERDTKELEQKHDWILHHFYTTPPISTHSVGIAVVNLQKKEVKLKDQKRSIRIFAQPHTFHRLKKLENLTVEYIHFLEEYLDFLLPPQQLDIVVLPKYTSEIPATHWGLVYIRDNVTHNDTHLPMSMTERVVSSRKILESLTTQWFEHMTTPYWWNTAPFALNVIKYLTRAYFQKMNIPGTYDFVSYFSALRRNIPEDVMQENNSHRALWVLQMLNNTLSEETFRKGLNRFLQYRKYATFSEKNFWDDMKQAAVHNGKLDPSFNMIGFVNSWMDEEHFPVVKVTRKYAAHTALLEQEVFYQDDSDHDLDTRSALFYIPIVYITEDNMNITTKDNVKWMKQVKQLIIHDLPPDNKFVIVNPEDIGLFIVNYDTVNWNLISSYMLKSANGSMRQIPPRTRAKLISDALNLAIAGELQFDVALRMTLPLKEEFELVVWESFIQVVDFLNIRIDGTPAGDMFKTYCSDLLKHFLTYMGARDYNESQYISQIRNDAHSLYIRLSDEYYNSKHYPIVRRWMEREQIDYWSETTCQALRWGMSPEVNYITRKIVDRITDYHEMRNKSMLYQVLTSCVYRKEHAKRILEILLFDESRHFSDADIMKAIDSLWKHAGGYSALFEILSEKWNSVKKRFYEKPELWKTIVKNSLLFNNLEGFNKAVQFYNERMNEMGSADVTARKGMIKMKRLSDWNQKHLPIMEVWLHQHLTVKY